MRSQPLIAVNDVQASSIWYQRVLGFVSGHGGNEYEQLMFDGQMVLQLHHWDAHDRPYIGNPVLKPYGNGVVLWFLATDVELGFNRAKAAGAEILEAIKVNANANHLEFWLRDPNGYVIVVAGAYGELGKFLKNT